MGKNLPFRRPGESGISSVDFPASMALRGKPDLESVLKLSKRSFARYYAAITRSAGFKTGSKFLLQAFPNLNVREKVISFSALT